jgi:lipopolysaccharide export system permease protein
VLLGLLTAGGTLTLYYDFIPRSHHMLRTQVFGDIEDILYTALKRQGSLRHPKRQYAMWVRQVQGHRLIDVIFKQRDDRGNYSTVARAREAHIHFVSERNVISVEMSYVNTFSENGVGAFFQDETQEVPVPTDLLGPNYLQRPSDLSWEGLLQRRQEVADEVRQAAENAEHPPVPPDAPPELAQDMAKAFRNLLPVKQREQHVIEVELYMRPALAVGCLCFALIGGPVGIWFSRADYLSAFVSCFLPTVFVYYPLLLCGTNLAKDGRIPPAVGLWAANAAVGGAAVVLYWRLLRR